MEYLGIKLSEDIEKIVALNLNPLFQKIKTTKTNIVEKNC